MVLSYRNLAQYPRVMTALGITDSSTIRGCILPMSHIVGPLVCNEVADKGFTLVIFDHINPVTLLDGIQKYRISVFESVPIVFQLLLGVRDLSKYDTTSVKIAEFAPIPRVRERMAASENPGFDRSCRKPYPRSIQKLAARLGIFMSFRC